MFPGTVTVRSVQTMRLAYFISSCFLVCSCLKALLTRLIRILFLKSYCNIFFRSLMYFRGNSGLNLWISSPRISVRATLYDECWSNLAAISSFSFLYWNEPGYLDLYFLRSSWLMPRIAWIRVSPKLKIAVLQGWNWHQLNWHRQLHCTCPWICQIGRLLSLLLPMQLMNDCCVLR